MVYQMTESTGYTLIEIESLLNDCITNFNLYILNEDNFVLFRSAELPFTDKHKQNLLSKKLKVYINSNDYQKYIEYLQSNIEKIQNDSSLTVELKTKYFYDASKIVIGRMFETANTGTADIKISAKILSKTTFSILAENRYDLRNILKVIDFEYSTLTHSLNISLLASSFAKYIKYKESDIPLIVKGALLHDLGKSKIDNRILLKPGKLDKDEWEEMKRHPQYGSDILKQHNIDDKTIENCAMYHHEKLDGTGYPRGLAGDDIPFEAQLIAVCDVFDALTTRRVYKNAMGSFPAFRIMLNDMSGSFNKELLHSFITMFKYE